MSFAPIFAPWAMLTIAAVLIGVRMFTLYRVLVRTGPGRYRAVVLRWSGLTLAVLLLLLAAARPYLAPEKDQAPPPPQTQTAANANVFFVVDRSVNQRVEDFGPDMSRMAGARADILALMNQYPRARFAVIGFSSQARLDWPLSDDAWSLTPFIEGLSPYTDVPLDAMFKVNAAAPAELLGNKLAEAAADFPGSKNLVFYFGSGAPWSRAEQGRFDLDKGLIAGGAVLGYGTAKGGPVPQGFYGGKLVYMADQQSGAPLNSSLGDRSLNEVAGQLGLPYFGRGENQPITPVLPTVELGTMLDENAVVAAKSIDRTELYWMFTMLASALILAEAYLTIRDIRRTHTAHKDVDL